RSFEQPHMTFLTNALTDHRGMRVSGDVLLTKVNVVGMCVRDNDSDAATPLFVHAGHDDLRPHVCDPCDQNVVSFAGLGCPVDKLFRVWRPSSGRGPLPLPSD